MTDTSTDTASTDTTATDTAAHEPSLTPSVVAVGASAGGLDALEKFFISMPPDTGAVFVVIQHLSPDHKSMMASLLSRHTTMPVQMVEADTPIRPNHVYLIPPGALLHMDGTTLRLTPKDPHTLTLPVDVFFQSLSAHAGERAVGVILSGTGSDGTRGAGAINEAGGFLLAQAPDSAKFDGMPRSVIATGLVDAILPVESMAERIVAHLHNPHTAQIQVLASLPNTALPVEPEAAMASIIGLLRELGGINFEDYKPSTVMRRIERRMVVQQVTSLSEYLQLLNQERAEVVTLHRELLIPVTSFFRDTEAFEVLRNQVIPAILAAKPAGQPIRVWCAGIATGEEAYSVAMLFLEAFETLKRWPPLKVFATDVEHLNIETASAGVYPESISVEVPAAQLDRFFNRKGGHFVVKPDLRQCIVFARHNLLSDPPFTKIDLVVCRNALIYFRTAAQERALRRMQYALNPGGYLFQGSSESLGGVANDFEAVSAKHKIWQVIRPTTLPLDLTRSKLNPVDAGAAYTRTGATSPRERQRTETVDQGLLTLQRAYAPPPGVLVNGRHELVHAYGDVNRYLLIRPGGLSLELNKVLPDELTSVAAALLFKVARENTRASSGVVRFTPPYEAEAADSTPPVRPSVRLSAWPAGELDGQRITLLAFEPVSWLEGSTLPELVDVPTETAERIQTLEHDLAATRESLQATIEELETSNEELQATNEELMASNEELQSSNEELQSVNEELNTVNAEYQEKIDILNRLNADLDNLTRVGSAGTVFVDQHLHLTRFNPDAAQIFRLRSVDLGRPLEDLTHSLDYPDLLADLRRTLTSETVFEKAVRSNHPVPKHWLVKMLPYRIPSSPGMGLVVSFTDVTSFHQLTHLQAVLDALGAHVAVLDHAGNITLVNRAWREFAQTNGDPYLTHSGVGANYLEACAPKQAQLADPDATKAAEGLQAVLQGQSEGFSLEYPCHSPTEQRWFVMHVRPLRERIDASDTKARRGAVVSHVNITAWRNAHSTAP